MTPAGVLPAGPVPAGDLVVVAAPLVDVVVEKVVRTERGADAAVSAVQVPGAVSHVREQDGFHCILRTLLLHQLVEVDAGTTFGIRAVSFAALDGGGFSAVSRPRVIQLPQPALSKLCMIELIQQIQYQHVVSTAVLAVVISGAVVDVREVDCR